MKNLRPRTLCNCSGQFIYFSEKFAGKACLSARQDNEPCGLSIDEIRSHGDARTLASSHLEAFENHLEFRIDEGFDVIQIGLAA